MKRLLRRLVVATAVPPWRALYRLLYRAVERLAASRLRRCPGVVAVYLTRGGAAGELVPGISDLDFVVVTADEGSLARVRRVGRRLRRATAGLVDTYPNFVMSRATLERRWRAAPAWRYRLDEARRHGRLRAGEPVLAALPPVAATWRAGCWLELCRWWIGFARMLDEGYHERDVVLRNATCYKAVTEVVRLRAALAAGEPDPRSRAAALDAVAAPLADRLRRIAAARYLADDPQLLEATCAFLLDAFAGAWREFERRPFLALRPEVAQELDGGPAPDPDPGTIAHARALGSEPAAGEAGLGPLHLLRSVSWDAEEWLLVVDADPRRPPGAAALAGLAAAHRRRRAEGPQVHLVLRLGPIGLPLTPSIPRELHRGILTPATTPDVFLQLGEPRVHWSELTELDLAGWRENEQWDEASPRQRRRLAEVAAGAAAGRIVYPQTRLELPR